MKKIIIAVILLVIITGGVALGIYLNSLGSDALKFKKEYEELNDKPIENSTNTYHTLNLPEKNPIVYSNYKEIFKILDGGSGVIYFGFPECPWCRMATPVLLEAANEIGLDKIYYMNNIEDRDIKRLVDGKIVEDQKASKEYLELLDKLGEHSSEYGGLEDSTIRRLYFPTVVFVKDGVIIGTIVGTVDSQENPYVSLTQEQRNELKVMYTDYISEVTLCTKSC